MTLAGILLRVALGISLLLNGIGASVAATAMLGPAAAATHGVVATDTASASAECHEHAAAGHDAPSVAPEPARDAPEDAPDCCCSGPCSCACAQLSTLAAVDLLFVPPLRQHAQDADAVAPSRPSPPLPHLIRPPIA
jgi:hypothetical protein